MKFTVNGVERTFDGDTSMPALWYVRDELGLNGTKFGCGVGLCGACTIHVNGVAVRSCQTSMGELSGKAVTTIEGPEQGRQSPRSGRLARAECAAMRLLPGRPDHAGRFASYAKTETDRSGDPGGHERQYLPLRLLPAHCHCGP